MNIYSILYIKRLLIWHLISIGLNYLEHKHFGAGRWVFYIYIRVRMLLLLTYTYTLRLGRFAWYYYYNYTIWFDWWFFCYFVSKIWLYILFYGHIRCPVKETYISVECFLHHHTGFLYILKLLNCSIMWCKIYFQFPISNKSALVVEMGC